MGPGREKAEDGDFGDTFGAGCGSGRENSAGLPF